MNPFLTFVAFTVLAFLLIWFYVAVAGVLGLTSQLTSCLTWLLIHFFAYSLFAALFPEFFFFEGVAYILIWQFIAWAVFQLQWTTRFATWNMIGWDIVFSAAGFSVGLGLSDIACLLK